ncbi:MAG: radical SAM protein [Solirubrobacterales bacterium]
MTAAVESLPDEAKRLYAEFGQRKPMGIAPETTRRPHFFLLRTFQGQTDLLVILNTKRCRYQCDFCQLPAKSSRVWIPGEDVVAQFGYVLEEVKHALSIVDRITLSNEGSVLDAKTLDPEALAQILEAVNEMRRVRTVVLETRLEFVDADRLEGLGEVLQRARINVLTGFETLDPDLREGVLRKREPLDVFREGLDRLASLGLDLTAYVLFKPAPEMTDAAAYAEARRSIGFLREECGRRGIGLTVRLNPMYLAEGSRWAQRAAEAPGYAPPRLSDCLRLAKEVSAEGVSIYLGLSAEGLSEPAGTYAAREDFGSEVLKAAKTFNSKQPAARSAQTVGHA